VYNYVDNVGEGASNPVIGRSLSRDNVVAGMPDNVRDQLLPMIIKLLAKEFTYLADGQSSNTCQGPGHYLRVAMLAQDIGMDMTAFNIQETSQQCPETGCIEDSSRPDYQLRRHIEVNRDPCGNMRHYIDRVRRNNKHGAWGIFEDRRDNFTEDRRIVEGQFMTGLPGHPASSRRHYHSRAPLRVGIITLPDID
jgi:hypothetical protein